VRVIAPMSKIACACGSTLEITDADQQMLQVRLSRRCRSSRLTTLEGGVSVCGAVRL
jgi:hypothetical protein